MEKRGAYFNGVMLLIHPISLLWFDILSKNNSRIVISIKYLLIFTFSIPLFFYGGRFVVVFTLFVMGLIYAQFKTNISLFKFSLFLIFLLSASMAYIGYRLFGSDLDMSLAANAVLADLFPEMRTFALAIKSLQPGNFFKEVFITPLIGIFPSGVLSLVGFDKKELWKPIGSTIVSIIPDAINLSGIRISLVGEVYLASKLTGTLLFMATLSAITYCIDSFFSRSRGLNVYPYILFAGLCSSLIAYGSIFIVTTVFIFIEGYIINKLNNKLTKC
jgi:hypothetical protein